MERLRAKSFAAYAQSEGLRKMGRKDEPDGLAYAQDPLRPKAPGSHSPMTLLYFICFSHWCSMLENKLSP